MGKRKKPIRLPTDREMSLILSKIKHPRTQLIVVLGLKMGLRASEITGLKLDDVDLISKTISLIGKGSKPAIIPITDEVLGYLERALKVRPTHLKTPFLIWNLRADKGISRFDIYYLTKKYGNLVGIHLHPHLLRHKYGTDIFNRSGDINKTKEALRHSRIATTAENYVHSSIEHKRETLNLLDSRHWLIKFLSKFKPELPNLIHKKTPAFTGDCIGRQSELSKLKANQKSGIHTILCGPKGCGKSFLLKQFQSKNIFHLGAIRPVREKLVELCEQMKSQGVINEIPKGRGSSVFLKALINAVESKKYILCIDTLSDLTKDSIGALRQLKEHFTIIGAVEPKHRIKLNEAFFGSHEIIVVTNLNRDDAYKLADIASLDLPTTQGEKELFLRKVVAESNGSPKAIMEIIDKERKRGKLIDATTEISHEANEPLPATAFLSFFLVVAVVSRYGASSMGMPDIKLILIFTIIIVALLIFTDKVLKQESK